MTRFEDLGELVGNTPLVRLGSPSHGDGVLFAKLEGFNRTGSIKDRPAALILHKAIEEDRIQKNSLIIESSSGNFGVALGERCRELGLTFVCVVDPNSTEVHRYMIEHLGARIEMVDQLDPTGGYLATRIARVRELLGRHANSFWTNQYANEMNSQAHYLSTGPEIWEQMGGRLTHLFAAVSSGGTITGCARYLKERDPTIQVIAVDVQGSVIFGGAAGRRYIPGVGSSKVPGILDFDLIDDVVHVAEESAVLECHRLLSEEGLFVGGSSGTASYAARNYLETRCPEGQVVRGVVIFPDRGERYFQSIFDSDWVAERYPRLKAEEVTDPPYRVAV